jgi:hypothetical protein
MSTNTLVRLSVVSLIFLITACAGTRETVPEEKPATTSESPYDESFDPRSLNDDDIVVGPGPSSGKADNGSGASAAAQTAAAEEVQAREINGFRVQILATNNIETASLVEQEATDRFKTLGHNTYLLFETPLYKIRIGDCENRSDAEALRDLAIENGYSGAFIVKSKITVQP